MCRASAWRSKTFSRRRPATHKMDAVAVAPKSMTLAAFVAFTELPENAERKFELVGGEIIEVPSNAYASHVGSGILAPLFFHAQKTGLGWVTGEQGGYMVAGEPYAPDAAFISKERQPVLAKQGYNPHPPNLAVEVDFPSTYQSQRALTVKIANYLAAGTLLWVVYPETKQVAVYEPGQPVKIVGIEGVLDGGEYVPGFSLAVKDIFPAERGQP
jgi:Uma2 family endonuclease